MTKKVKTDVLHVAICDFALGGIMVLIFALAGHFSLDVVWGALYGCAFVSLSFLQLAISVSKNIKKDPKNAQARVSATYTFRLLCVAAMIIVAVKVPFINWVSACVPLIYNQTVIMAVGYFSARKESGEVMKK